MSMSYRPTLDDLARYEQALKSYRAKREASGSLTPDIAAELDTFQGLADAIRFEIPRSEAAARSASFGAPVESQVQHQFTDPETLADQEQLPEGAYRGEGLQYGGLGGPLSAAAGFASGPMKFQGATESRLADLLGGSAWAARSVQASPLGGLGTLAAYFAPDRPDIGPDITETPGYRTGARLQNWADTVAAGGSPETLGSIPFQASSAGAQVGGMAAAASLGGPVGMGLALGSMGMGQAAQTMERGLEKGMSEADAYRAGLNVAIPSTALETIPATRFLKAVPSSRIATALKLVEAMDSSKAMTAKRASAIGWEGFEEGATQAMQNVAVGDPLGQGVLPAVGLGAIAAGPAVGLRTLADRRWLAQQQANGATPQALAPIPPPSQFPRTTMQAAAQVAEQKQARAQAEAEMEATLQAERVEWVESVVSEGPEAASEIQAALADVIARPDAYEEGEVAEAQARLPLLTAALQTQIVPVPAETVPTAPPVALEPVPAESPVVEATPPLVPPVVEPSVEPVVQTSVPIAEQPEPGVSVPEQAGPAVASAPVVAKSKRGKKPKLAVAFHGSPYDFDEFTTQKIGTGEGAQAYGHGLYFAGNKAVAETYRDKLAKRTTIPGSSTGGSRWLVKGADFPEGRSGQAALDVSGDIDSYLYAHKNGQTEMAEMLRDKIADRIEYQDKFSHTGSSGDDYVAIRDFWRDYASKATPEQIVERAAGKLYEVDLKPADDEWLDWDKPLSQQSEKVRAAIVPLVERIADTPARNQSIARRNEALRDGTATGGELYRAMTYLHPREGAFGMEIPLPDSVAAARVLREAGVPGIRYLDQSSRGKGEGTYNYVVFSDDDIKITSKMAVGRGAAGNLGLTPEAKIKLAAEAAKVVGVSPDRFKFVASIQMTPERAAQVKAEHGKDPSVYQVRGETAEGVVTVALEQPSEDVYGTAWHETYHMAREARQDGKPVLPDADHDFLANHFKVDAELAGRSIEEEIPEQFRGYALGHGNLDYHPRVREIFDRILAWLSKLAAWLRSNGVNVAADIWGTDTARARYIFHRLRSGQMAAEAAGEATAAGGPPQLSVGPRAVGEKVTLSPVPGRILEYEVVSDDGTTVVASRYSKSKDKEETRTFTKEQFERQAAYGAQPKDKSKKRWMPKKKGAMGLLLHKDTQAAVAKMAKRQWIISDIIHYLMRAGPAGQEIAHAAHLTKLREGQAVALMIGSLTEAMAEAKAKAGRAPTPAEMKLFSLIVEGRSVKGEMERLQELRAKAPKELLAGLDHEIKEVRRIANQLNGFDPGEHVADVTQVVEDKRIPTAGKTNRLTDPNHIELVQREVQESPTDRRALMWRIMQLAYRKVDDALKTNFDEVAGKAAAGWVPNHFYKTITPRARKLFKDKNSTAFKNVRDLIAAEQWLKASEAGKQITVDEARAKAELALDEEIRPPRGKHFRKRMGAFEMHREDVDMPWSVREMSAEILARYANDAGRAIAQFEGLADIAPNGDVTLSPSDGLTLRTKGVMEFTRDDRYEDRIKSLALNTGLNTAEPVVEDVVLERWLNAIGNVLVGVMLHSPHAIIQNLGTAYGMGQVHYGAPAMLKTLWTLNAPGVRKRTRARLKRAGVGADTRFTPNVLTDLWLGDTVWEEIAHWVAYYGTHFVGPLKHLSFATSSLHQLMAFGVQALYHAQDQIKVIVRDGKFDPMSRAARTMLGFQNNDPEVARRQLRTIHRMTDAEIDRAVKAGTLGEELENKIMKVAADQYGGGRSQLYTPQLVSAQPVRPFMFLMGFMAAMARGVNNMVIREAFPQPDPKTGKRGKADFGPLLRLVTIGPAVALLISELSDWWDELFGKERVRSWTYFDGAIQKLVHAWLEGMIFLGLPYAFENPADIVTKGASRLPLLPQKAIDFWTTVSMMARSNDWADRWHFSSEMVAQQVAAIRLAQSSWRKWVDSRSGVVSETRQLVAQYRLQVAKDKFGSIEASARSRLLPPTPNIYDRHYDALQKAIEMGRYDKAEKAFDEAVAKIAGIEYADEDEPDLEAARRVRGALMARSPLGSLTKALDLKKPDVSEKLEGFQVWLEKTHPGDYAHRELEQKMWIDTLSALIGPYE